MIGIVAILIAVLLPTLAAARRAARTTTCAANLRQIGIVMHLYADANQDHLPWAFIGFKPTPASGFLVLSWDDQCDRVLGGNLTDAELSAHSAPRDKPVLRCPADELPAEWQADPAIATTPPDLQRRRGKSKRTRRVAISIHWPQGGTLRAVGFVLLWSEIIARLGPEVSNVMPLSMTWIGRLATLNNEVTDA